MNIFELNKKVNEAAPQKPIGVVELQEMGADASLIPDPVEGASLGFEGEAQPSRVTGLGDGLEPVFGDSILTTAITGFNRGLANLVDPVIYNAAVAFRKIGEQAGLPFLANIKPDRNEMARVFASGDFETQNIMSNVLGIPLNYGEGADIGVTPEEGLASEFVYGAGKFLGEGAPVAAGLQAAANVAARSGALLTPTTTAPTYVAPEGGTALQRLGQTLDEAITPGQTTTNVVSDILQMQARAPGTVAATEAGISGLAGGVTETTDSPVLGITAALGPAAIPQIVKNLPIVRGGVGAIGWLRQRTPGKVSDLRDVATGAKSATEGEGGQFLVNKAQRMIQEQLNLNPEQSKAAVERFQEIVAKIPELETMAPGQVFNNQALIKTFQEALLDAPNEQIDALNALLQSYVSGATRFKGTIGVEGTDTGVTGSNILVMDSARKTFDLGVAKEAEEITDAEAFLTQQARGIERTGAERQTERLKLQASLAKRVEDAREAVEKEKIRLGIVQERRPIKASGKREKVLTRPDDLVEPAAVLALQQRVQREILPREGTEAFSFDKLPASIKSIAQWDSSKDFTFRDWLLAREEVSNAISKGSTYGDAQLPTLMAYRDMLEDFAITGFNNLGPKYKEFIDFAKTNLYDPFERSLIMSVTRKDQKADRFITQGEQITKTFLKQEPEILRRFVETVGTDAPEVNDLKNVLLDDLYDSAYVASKGQWDEARINKWMGDNKNYLDLLPGTGGPMTAGRKSELFKAMGEEGALTEYPDIAKAIDSYVDQPRTGRANLEKAAQTDEYQAYKQTLNQNLDIYFPDGKVPVRRIKDYMDPRAKDREVSEFEVDTSDIAFVSDIAEREIIYRGPDGRLTSGFVTSEIGDNNFFQDLTNTQRLLQQSLLRRKQATQRKEEIQKSLLGKFFERETKQGTLQPEEDFLTQLVMRPTKEGGQRTMVKTRNDFLASEEGKSLGKTGAENVFRRTIFEKLDEQMKIMQDPEKFKGWMQQDKNTQLLKDAGFSESHMKDLYLLADASERINTIPILEFKGLNSSGIVAKIAEALGTSPAAVSTRVLAVKENRISPRTAFIYLASRAIGAQNEIRMNALMREAITDPQLAKMLTTELPEANPVGRIPGPIQRKVNNYLIGSGIEAVEQINQEMEKARPLATFPSSGQSFGVNPETNQNIDTTPIAPAPPPPSMDFSQIAPPPPIAPTGGSQVDVASLFPFDPTSAAIQRRRQQQQGLGSLMT